MLECYSIKAAILSLRCLQVLSESALEHHNYVIITALKKSLLAVDDRKRDVFSHRPFCFPVTAVMASSELVRVGCSGDYANIRMIFLHSFTPHLIHVHEAPPLRICSSFGVNREEFKKEIYMPNNLFNHLFKKKIHLIAAFLLSSGLFM